MLDELLLALKYSPVPVQIIFHIICYNISATIPSLNYYIFLYNKIWTTHIFPKSWGFAYTIPIIKKTGRLTDPSAFRPIALTSCLCKVMEGMVKRRLLFVLEAKGLLGNEQSGFRKYGSTMDHLTHLKHCISEAFAKKEFMIGVPLDIHKAFDMTWRHRILMVSEVTCPFLFIISYRTEHFGQASW